MAEKDNSFFKRLNKVLTTSVAVHSPHTNKVKYVDLNKLSPSLESNRPDRYNRAYSSIAHLRGSTYYDTALFRTQLYRDYDVMDTADPIIGSALDIYSEESTLRDEYGDIISIKAPNEKIADSLHTLFYDVLNIEFNLAMWIRGMCKYGDHFLHLDITENVGVTGVQTLTVYDVERIENPADNDDVVFTYEPTYDINIFGKREFQNYEVAHFRLYRDPNFLPYGRSMLEGIRRIWKQLTLMEDAMMIHRVMRAPDKRVFKIDVAGLPPAEIDSYMEQVIGRLKKVPYIDPQTGEYNLQFNLMNMLEDFYFPVRGGQSGTEVDTLSGMQFTGIEDIDYLKNKMFAGLKIPKAFLTYDETIQSKATLAGEDIRFSRTIESIQRIFVSELYKIAVIHLYAQGFNLSDVAAIELSLCAPSTVYRMEQFELLGKQIELANSIKEQKLLPDEFIYSKIYDLPTEEIYEYKEKLIRDAKWNFRLNQISEQGNDPAITKDTVGTEFDKNLQQSAKLNKIDDNEIDDIAKELVAKSINDDAIDIQEKQNMPSLENSKLSKGKSSAIRTRFSGGSPLALSEQKRKQKLVEQTFNYNDINKDKDSGTLLDENNLII